MDSRKILPPFRFILQKVSFWRDKLACGVFKASIGRWNSRLGHPTIPMLQRVIGEFVLSCLAQQELNSVCDTCQQAKSHQLSYPKSTSVSHHPLELVFSNLWGLNHLVNINTT
jgi:hypothetical protein